MKQSRRKVLAPFAVSLITAGLAMSAASGAVAQNTSGTNSSSSTNRNTSQGQGSGSTNNSSGVNPNSASGNSRYPASERALIQAMATRLTPAEQRTFSQMLSHLSDQERQVFLKVARGGTYGSGVTGTGTGSGTGTGGTSTGTSTGTTTGSGSRGTGTSTGGKTTP